MAAHAKEPMDEGEHDGGAWKVAYADFVTALMALFIVLWLMNVKPEVRQAISHYFKEPKAKASLSVVGGPKTASPTGDGSGIGLRVDKKNVTELRDRLQEAMRTLPQFRKFQSFVQFGVSDEGLRVELMENEGGMFFQSGSANPSASGELLFRMLAQEMGKLPNDVAIEGHTDSRPFRANSVEAYGNWELSFDRANMARRIMLAHGLRPEQVSEIRGYADRQALVTGDPADSRNRRVSVIVKYGEDQGRPA
jgi:chemotaxis protein MotB